MAAIIDIRTGAGLAEQLSAEESAMGGFAAQQSSPRLRVIHGGKSELARQRRRVFLMRRAVVLVVLSAVLLGAGLLLRSGLSAAFSQSATSGSAVGALAAGIDPTVPYFVQPGDSLWTVAQRVSPQQDPRDVIDQIVALNSTSSGFSPQSPLRVGQSLRLPVGSTF
ncbi:unannotated protein [freshwater metagenome]|uniref:Unannotated protein n=1 Tax=freshwater metagenome TaxID=449393 RepID=A0A6J7FVD2_9ZZZZ